MKRPNKVEAKKEYNSNDCIVSNQVTYFANKDIYVKVPTVTMSKPRKICKI